MNDNNAYKPPNANVASDSDKPPLNTAAKVVLLLIALQVTLSGVNTSTAFEFVNDGSVSAVSLLNYLLSILLLIVGGLVLVFKSRVAMALFIVATVFAVITAWQWFALFSGWPQRSVVLGPNFSPASTMWRMQPILLISCASLAALACIVSFQQKRLQSS